MVRPNHLTVQCRECDSLVTPTAPANRRAAIVVGALVLGLVGFFIGSVFGIATAGVGFVGTVVTVPLGLYGGAKGGDMAAAWYDSYSCPACGAAITAPSLPTRVLDFVRGGSQSDQTHSDTSTPQQSTLPVGETVSSTTEAAGTIPQEPADYDHANYRSVVAYFFGAVWWNLVALLGIGMSMSTMAAYQFLGYALVFFSGMLAMYFILRAVKVWNVIQSGGDSPEPLTDEELRAFRQQFREDE